MEDIFCRINKELKYHEENGLLIWLGEDLSQAFLLECVDLHLEVLACWEANCELKCFLFCGKPFHLLLYFTSDGEQENVRFLWHTEKKLVNLVDVQKNCDKLQICEGNNPLTNEKGNHEDKQERK